MVHVQVFLPEVWDLIGGALQLQGNEYLRALTAEGGIPAAVAIVLAAGLSEGFGQSIVLFANRVKPARFVFSLFVDSVLFTFGYGFVVLSTWLVCRVLSGTRLSLADLALVLAMSYAPMLFAFLAALPYLGARLLDILRVWHFLAMVVAVAAVARTDVFAAATYVWLGWFVMVVAQRSFGKPIVALATRILDAVAGVRLVDDAQIAIGRAEEGASMSPAVHNVPAPHKTATHSQWWVAVVGLGAMAVLGVIVALALQPVRNAIFGWQHHLPAVLQVPIDLLWLAIIAVLVAAFMAPFETLGWWAGWYGDRIDTSEATRPSRPTKKDVARYVVYLDGIAQSSGTYTPDIETFLDAMSPELPKKVVLVRGVMAYSVLNKPLEDDPILSLFWKFVDASRSRAANSLLGWFINLRNVTIVAVSADPRYGPMYNFGMADVIYRSLIANGYRKGSGTPVTLIGYSGGGQMACGSASFLKHAIDAPVDVISLGGVISGNDPILQLEHLYHLVGDRDGVEKVGPLMFASRWPIAVLSNWNRAKRLGTLSRISLGPVGHQVPGGMLDPGATLPDGRTNLRQTLDYIECIVTDRFVPIAPIPRKPTNYGRYVGGIGELWASLASNRTDPPAEVAARGHYVPAADWIGRLILPERTERFGGALFEVSNAPPARADLVGRIVRLRWSDDLQVRERVRAAVRDVNFSAEAASASTYGGFVMPDRLNRWRLVDPLESLAGSHPIDDVVVKLAGNVIVEDAGEGATLRIEREPVQITGRFRGLVTFLGPAPGLDRCYRVLHFNRNARAFDGTEDIVEMPPIVPDLDERPNSVTRGIERSPLNPEGWYVCGAFRPDGRFVVQALLPRGLLRIDGARKPLADTRAAYRYARRDAWRELTAGRGGTIAAQTEPWSLGDTGLVVHTYGGIGGKNREAAASGPIYFGHFAYGCARAVSEPLSGESVLEVTYYQVYTQNGDGLTAGALDWTRYMGDRQFGWLGVRPTCDAILRLDELTRGLVRADGEPGTSALDAIVRQLEVMTARYRIGDGTGGTFVAAANNCAQDSNHALFAALRSPEFARDDALASLVKALRKKLQPFGAPRRDWSQNVYNLGTTMEDAPLQNLITALGSWRCILPRLAFNTIVGTFLRHGATLTILGTSQVGGERNDVAAVAPTAF